MGRKTLKEDKKNLALINARHSANLSQKELSDLIGISDSAYGKYELSQCYPSKKNQEKILAVLKEKYDANISIEDLFPGVFHKSKAYKNKANRLELNGSKDVFFSLNNPADKYEVWNDLPLMEDEFAAKENEEYVGEVLLRLMNATQKRNYALSSRRVLTEMEVYILNMHFINGQSIREIAGTYGVPERRIYSKKDAALKKLNKLVNEGFINNI